MSETKHFEITPYDQLRLDGERVMLVGGAGFIGHHLALALRKLGAETLVVDHLQVNNLVAVVSDPKLEPIRRAIYTNFLLERFALMRDAGVMLKNVDARQMADLATIFNDFLPTKIVHLAAISSAVVANQMPSFAYDLQINTLRIVLELCRLKESVCDRVAFLSSSTVYGDFEQDSVDETVRPRPRGAYANGKYMGERMVREANLLFGVDYAIIRPSALYGIRCISGRVSQKFIESALIGRPLVLEGGGSGKLDFTSIDDVVRGIVLALFLPGGASSTFNITYGDARPIVELADIIRDLIPNVVIENGPAAKEKPKRGTLEITRACELLGFRPSISLKVGYRKFCEWYIDEWGKVESQLPVRHWHSWANRLDDGIL